MKILLVHNRDQLHPAESLAFEEEKSLLESKGHEIITYLRDNDEIPSYNAYRRIELPFETIYSMKTYRALEKTLLSEKPDVVHIHNFYPLISPSAFAACINNRIPFVHTLHSYRIVCANAMLFRNNKHCERCIKDKNVFSGVQYRCFKTKKQTLTVSAMLSYNQSTLRKADRYIVLTAFQKKRLQMAGYPKSRISVKPYFVYESRMPDFRKEDYAVFIGNLSIEKGAKVLSDSWKDSVNRLVVLGDGPLKNLYSLPAVKTAGPVSNRECLEIAGNARFLIFPSIWAESFPRVIIEAFSRGTAVLASDFGSMKEIVSHKKTGLLFRMGDPSDLRKKADWLFRHPEKCIEMGRNAYNEYLEKYTPDKSHEALMEVYREILPKKNEILSAAQ